MAANHTQARPVSHSVGIQLLTFIPQGPWMNPLISDFLSCLLFRTLGMMSSSCVFPRMWSVISAEDIFPFQETLWRATAGWNSHLEERQVGWVLSQSASVRCPL